MRVVLRALVALAVLPVSVAAQTPAPATVTVGSWNIEQFGETKATDPVRLARIADVAATFDILAIQEVVKRAGPRGSRPAARVDPMTMRRKHG